MLLMYMSENELAYMYLGILIEHTHQNPVTVKPTPPIASIP